MDKQEYENLSDEEFCKIFACDCLKRIEDENDGNYVVNRPQWLKMVEVLDYFQRLAKKSNGVVEPCEVAPKFLHGGVTASFTVVDIQEDDIPEFCKALLKTNAITIDATIDGKVCISVSIPYVFKKKS